MQVRDRSLLFVEHADRAAVPGDGMIIRISVAPSDTFQYEGVLDDVGRASSTALHPRGHESGTDVRELGALSDTSEGTTQPMRDWRRGGAWAARVSCGTARPVRLAKFSSCGSER